MPKNLRNCPRCKTDNLSVEFAVVKKETCSNCTYFTQHRITPIITSGKAMLEYLVTYFLEHGVNGSTLKSVLQQLLHRVATYTPLTENEGR